MGGRIKIRDINQSPGDRQEASGGNEPLPGFSGGQQGSIAFRGASKWEILGPDTVGEVLTTNGPGADPSWETITQAGVTKGGPTATETSPTVETSVA